MAPLDPEAHFSAGRHMGRRFRSTPVFDKQYRVTRTGPSWTIAYKGFRAGDFPTGQAAVAKAEHLAREARGCGYDTELVIEDEQGRVAERRRFCRGVG